MKMSPDPRSRAAPEISPITLSRVAAFVIRVLTANPLVRAMPAMSSASASHAFNSPDHPP